MSFQTIVSMEHISNMFSPLSWTDTVTSQHTLPDMKIHIYIILTQRITATISLNIHTKRYGTTVLESMAKKCVANHTDTFIIFTLYFLYTTSKGFSSFKLFTFAQ
jgi:hypothetical protein